MNTSSGLSSSNNRNAMQLDAATRDGIIARNQARVLSSLGVIKSDGFESGGLNPLKGLYSAAAAAFLKNKQGGALQSSTKFKGGFERAADVMSKLVSEKKQSSGVSDGPRTIATTGPAKVSYSKYSWTGNTVTGSDSTPESSPVEPDPAPQASTDDVIAKIEASIAEQEGSFLDNGDGSFDVKVLDISGTFKRNADSITGELSGDGGIYRFELRKDGKLTIDASDGNTESAAYAQVEGLLSGSLAGAPRVGAAPAEPAEPAEPAGPAPAEPAPAQPKPVAGPDSTLDEYFSTTSSMSSERTGEMIGRLESYLAKAGEGSVTFEQDRLEKALTVLEKYGRTDKVRDAAKDLLEDAEDDELGLADAQRISSSLKSAFLESGGLGGAISSSEYTSVVQLSQTFQEEVKFGGGKIGSKNADGSINFTFKGLSGRFAMTDGGIRGRLSGLLTSFEFSTDMSGHSATNTSGVTLLTQSAVNSFKDVLKAIDRSNAGSVSAVA